jgi:hypothetical protein
MRSWDGWMIRMNNVMEDGWRMTDDGGRMMDDGRWKDRSWEDRACGRWRQALRGWRLEANKAQSSRLKAEGEQAQSWKLKAQRLKVKNTWNYIFVPFCGHIDFKFTTKLTRIIIRVNPFNPCPNIYNLQPTTHNSQPTTYNLQSAADLTGTIITIITFLTI